MPAGTNSTPSPRAARRPVRGPRDSALPVPAEHPGGKAQRKARSMLMDRAQLELLENNLRLIGLYVNCRHLEMLAPPRGDALYESRVVPIAPAQRSRSGIAVYQLTRLMYNRDENSYEKLVSVYSAMNAFGGLVALILQSDGESVRLYLASNTSGGSAIAAGLLEGNLRGQFPGCELRRLPDSERDTLLDSWGGADALSAGRTVRSLSMIPSRREDERRRDREFSAQGYEKFIDAMRGRRFTLVVLSQRVPPDAAEECLEGLETLYTGLSPCAKETASYGENDSDSVGYAVSSSIGSALSRSISRSFGTSHTSSVSRGGSSSFGRGYELFGIHFNSGSGASFSSSAADGSVSGEASSDGTSESFGSGDSQSASSSRGTNRSLTMSRDNKAVQNLLAKLEDHMKRISGSQTFGMWNSACYLVAGDAATAAMGTSTLAALFSGDSQAAPRAYCSQWDAACPRERDAVLDYLGSLQHPVVSLTVFRETAEPDGAKTRSVLQTERLTPAMMISGKEIPTLMGLPRKSVPGVAAESMAEFGRGLPEPWKRSVKRPIRLGTIYHMGREEAAPVLLNLDTLASHTFLCGSSGSGKSSTTCHLLQRLAENRVPFLVVEPAKGEYKREFAGFPGINIFTAEESPYRLLRINPFEFCPGIHIREHLDSVLQAVSACWPLYGAMPGLLKKAFEQVYLDHGWDLEHSERIVRRGSKFPVFRDLAAALERIIDESPYSAQTKGDYKGALLNRVSSLCNGFEGQIFGRSMGVPDRRLFGENTIIDLSSIGSEETRSLIMGILIIKLKNYRKASGGAPDGSLVHVTVLEEAHTILKRCSQETGVEAANVQGAAVGSLCRCIAEMRSAGEGFVVIDQSPGAVDEAAIKNTAIKIVMRLPSKKDCEEIGAALSLTEQQIRELSRLDVGVAAVSHVGWTDTVLARMGNAWDHRYRAKTPPVLDKGVCTRVQGALVQLLYRELREGELETASGDAQELLRLLCAGPAALRPALPPAKRQELLEEVQLFLEENEQLLRARRAADLERVFFDFVFSFLRLDSVLRIFPPVGVSAKCSPDPLTPKEIRAAVRWEGELRPAIARYLHMPAECDPAGAYRWPLSPEDAQYFGEILGGLLFRYAQRRRDDDRWMNAVSYLRSAGFFAGPRGRR